MPQLYTIMLSVIIDSHTHVFDPAVILDREKYCTTDSCFKLLYSQSKARMGSAEDLVNVMDQQEVSRSLVLNIGWESHEMCVRTNDYILESIAKYPNRLMGLCAVQPLAGDKALKEVERCSKAGAKGLGELRPDVQGFDLMDTATMMPLVGMLNKNNMILSLHASEPVGHAYQGKGKLGPAILYSFIKKVPGLKILLAHFGGGLAFYESMPEVHTALKNTYYDTAAAPFLYHPHIYRALTEIAVGEKLMFGSDWPLLDAGRVIEHIKSVPLDGAYLERILHINAEKFLDLH